MLSTDSATGGVKPHGPRLRRIESRGEGEYGNSHAREPESTPVLTPRSGPAAVEACDGYVDEEIGECLLALGRSSEAAVFFGRAFAALRTDPGLAANEPDILARLEKLGGG